MSKHRLSLANDISASTHTHYPNIRKDLWLLIYSLNDEPSIFNFWRNGLIINVYMYTVIFTILLYRNKQSETIYFKMWGEKQNPCQAVPPPPPRASKCLMRDAAVTKRVPCRTVLLPHWDIALYNNNCPQRLGGYSRRRVKVRRLVLSLSRRSIAAWVLENLFCPVAMIAQNHRARRPPPPPPLNVMQIRENSFARELTCP